MANLFYNIYLFINKRKVACLIAFLISLSGLIYLSTNLEFEEDITKLIPINEQNENAGKVFKTVNFADKIIVNISKEKNGSTEDLTKYASVFLDSINQKATEYVLSIQGKVEDETIINTLDFVYNNLPLFLDDTDYDVLAGKLNPDSILSQTESNYKTLMSPSGLVAKKHIVKDPLGLSFIGLKKLQSLSFGENFNLHNGFILSEDNNHILLFISPTHPASETGENSKFAEILYRISHNLNQEYESKANSEYFGGALIAVENAKQIKHDIQFTVGIAMTVLLLILIFFYRKLLLPIILFVPTIFGGLIAMVMLYLLRDKISAVSLGIGSVLLGVTLDYSLHVLTHIRGHQNIKALFQDITKPILMSSLTTALAFLCLLFLDSQALQDLGIFAASSVLGASFFALIFIPQVYQETSKKTYKKTILDSFSEIPLHKKKWMFAGLGVLLIISLFTYKKVGFNNDITKLNYEPLELMAAQKRLDKLTNIASKSVYIAAYGDDLQQALEENDLVFQKLQNLKEKETIIDFSSVGGLVKSNKTQEEKLSKWNSFWNDKTKESLKNNLISSGDKLGFKSTTHQQFYELLDKSFHALSIEDYQSIKTLDIKDFIGSKDDFSTVTSLVKLDKNHVSELNEELKDQSQILIIDRQGMNETFLGNLKNDFNELVLYSLIVVLLILLTFYRSFSLTFVTSIPIALTWFLTLGIMGLFGIQFNIFNIIISTFIFGLGIDYSIFITNGLLHQYRSGEDVLPTHKTSIILSVITTILGVGVMIFAKHPALYTISLVSIIGILSAMLISFTVQPLLFLLFIGSRHKRPISFRYLLGAIISFSYYGLGTVLIPLVGTLTVKLLPVSRKKTMPWFHNVASKFMKSVLYSNPFVKKQIINNVGETFEKPAIIIANHTSFLDTLALEMLYPKIIFLVNDWVYKSPIFSSAMKFTGYYPVSEGIDNGMNHLKEKIEQGYSIVVFPEGTRSYTHKIKRFHKGAFHLAETFQLDILPVIIHGNSEVIPKGSFVIRDGGITLKVLDRISPNDLSYGSTARERTKQISRHFKQEFLKFRRSFEKPNYFHKLLLDDYRYKGENIFNTVKQDLKDNQDIYQTILKEVTPFKNIGHISQDFGQLDFLLALDDPDKNLIVSIRDKEAQSLLKNSYLANNHYLISFEDSIGNILGNDLEVLILDDVIDDQIILEFLNNNDLKLIILLKAAIVLSDSIKDSYKSKTVHDQENLIILKP